MPCAEEGEAGHMREIERRQGMLRLLLADLTARREQTETALHQVREQKARLVEFTVQRNAPVTSALTALAELDERLTSAESDLRHIEMLRRRAQEELDALLVMRGVADARERLDELAARRAILLADDATGAAHAQELSEIDAEMAGLNATIEVASAAAARALSDRDGES